MTEDLKARIRALAADEQQFRTFVFRLQLEPKETKEILSSGNPAEELIKRQELLRISVEDVKSALAAIESAKSPPVTWDDVLDRIGFLAFAQFVKILRDGEINVDTSVFDERFTPAVRRLVFDQQVRALNPALLNKPQVVVDAMSNLLGVATTGGRGAVQTGACPMGQGIGTLIATTLDMIAGTTVTILQTLQTRDELGGQTKLWLRTNQSLKRVQTLLRLPSEMPWKSPHGLHSSGRYVRPR